MAADDARRVLRVPGRLSYGCTDLTLAWPHGGTGLGAIRQLAWLEKGGSYPVTCEAFGGEPVEYLEPGVEVGLAFVLRTNEDDPISTVYRNTTAGTTSQRRTISEPGTTRAGNWMSARAVTPLVFTPEGSTHARSATTPDADAPFIVLYKAIPILREDLEIPLERDQEWAIRCVFRGIRNSNGKVWYRGPRIDGGVS